MGSFYSSCSVSHMRLIDQKTSIQLLVPGYSTNLESYKSMIVSNDGCQALYSPFAFPIHGTYYDYGRIDNIIEDKNTKMLEEYFNMSISEIISFIGRERDVPESAKNVEFYNKLSMTFIRTEVLEHLESGWDKIDLVSPKQYSNDYYISEFIKYQFNESVNAENIKRRFDELTKKEKLSEEENVEISDLLSEMMSTLKSSFNKPSCYISCPTSNNMFNILKIDESFKDDILKQSCFLNKLGHGLGRTLMPSDYGTQEDNFSETYKLNELVNDLLVEDMKRHNVDYGYDEFETDFELIIKRHQRNKNIRNLGV